MINNSKPGDEWRQSRGTGYVPLGLTAEEYERIKAKERKSLQSKNLGMWGPRFSQSSRPDGDWMVQPKLWTQGFNSQRTNLQSSTSSGANGEGAVVDKDMSNLKAWIRFGKKHYPAFIALYFTLQSIQVALVLSRYFLFNTFKETTFSSGPLSIVSAVKLAFLGIFQSTYFRQNILGSCASWELASIKFITAFCFACPFDIFLLQNLQKFKKWTRAKSVVMITTFGTLGLFSWSAFLAILGLSISLIKSAIL